MLKLPIIRLKIVYPYGCESSILSGATNENINQIGSALIGLPLRSISKVQATAPIAMHAVSMTRVRASASSANRRSNVAA